MQKKLIVDENHILFNTHGMYYKEFPSDLRQVRFYTVFIVQRAPEKFREVNLLEQQLSEIIKNAIKHGNKNEIDKKVRVWYDFNKRAKIIVEDEGKGFKQLEEWNKFNQTRNKCFEEHDFDNMEKYVSFRSKDADEADGGNALFAGLEYWNGGMIYNKVKNKVCVVRYFPDEPEQAKNA